MKCQYHPNNEAIGVCVICGRAICGEDMNLVDGRYICNPCLRERKRPLLKRKSPFLAMLLNAFPGLGYIYLGLFSRALIVFLTFFTLVALSEDVPILGLFIAALFLFAFIDGFHQARLVNANLYDAPIAETGAGKSALYVGIAFIIVGGILFINQFIHIDFSFLSQWWPLILVAVGAYLILSARKSNRDEEQEALEEILQPGSSTEKEADPSD